MAQKITFSPAMIDALCEGSLADPLTPGLAIEVLKSGKKRWRYRRQVARQKVVATIFGGLFPAQSIAEAREWARELNLQVEAGIDPRAIQRAEKARNEMTVAKAHGLYMVAVHEGRSSRAKRINKPRTIKDKMDVYNHDIAPTLGNRNIYEVTERDLINLVEAKGKTAKVRANRLAAELKVFFGWAASLRGLEVGLEADPSKRLGDLRFPEKARTRKLSHLELEWFLQALVEEERDFQRGLLLCLLSAARITEVARARSDEIVNGVWTIPATRAKNSFEHSIALGPWGRSLMQTNHEWVFQAIKIDGPRNNSVWYKARDRVLARMEKLAGHPIERFTPHDFRRTARSNTKRLKVDFETAEAMLNHVKKGMERTYDLYEMEDEKRLWFLKWEEEVAAIAVRVGVAAALGVPGAQAPVGYSFSIRAASTTGYPPSGSQGNVKTQAFAQPSRTTAKITFTRVIR
ncbi:tyrosine-type recombinase/integrase [Novosphingobium humi]|uniref:tyrosine-type recombinase/integrase n=1 Tax=Novosphingobium humi TaxID=2282397 RepID=UPI0025B0C4A3|nr:integrase arm-type DNA-binding domain-containing protein [Novosphingobium humi]WJT00811.1 integrase arm-type DNA-binding domain-containing protein [Novosphingobium humi]